MSARVLAATFGARALARLRAGGFLPVAWWGLLTWSWAEARTTAAAHPSLTRSWGRHAAGMVLLALAGSLITYRRQGRRVAIRSSLPLLLATAAQAFDSYVHVGLHRAALDPAAPRHPVLGPANALTAIRGTAASWTWSRFVAGAPLDDAELAAVLAIVVATDCADGAVARATGLVSPFGGYLDAEADLFAWLAILATQVRRRQLAPWFAVLVAFRWLAPTSLGLVLSFMQATPRAIGSTELGRIAGFAQVGAAAIAVITATRFPSPRWRAVGKGAQVIAGGLLAVTGIWHIWRLFSGESL